MNPRHPRITNSITAERRTPALTHHDVEPKVARESDWRARPSLGTDQAPRDGTQNDPDFDIAAWFALEVDETVDATCLAECWYG